MGRKAKKGTQEQPAVAVKEPKPAGAAVAVVEQPEPPEDDEDDAPERMCKDCRRYLEGETGTIECTACGDEVCDGCKDEVGGEFYCEHCGKQAFEKLENERAARWEDTMGIPKGGKSIKAAPVTSTEPTAPAAEEAAPKVDPPTTSPEPRSSEPTGTIQITAGALRAALSAVMPCVSRSPVRPVLRCVRIGAEGIEATDLETRARVALRNCGALKQALLPQAEALAAALSTLDAGDGLVLEEDAGHLKVWVSGGGMFKVYCHAKLDEFPEWKAAEGKAQELRVNALSLAQAFEEVRYAVPNAPGRYAYNGTHLRSEKTQLIVEACTGVMLACVPVPCEGVLEDNPGAEPILPLKFTQAAAAALKTLGEDVAAVLTWSGRVMTLEAGAFRLATLSIEGTYPRVPELMKRTAKDQAFEQEFARAGLLQALDRARVMCGTGSEGVLITMGPEGGSLYAGDVHRGESRVPWADGKHEEAVEVKVTGAYLAATLKHWPSERARIGFTKTESRDGTAWVLMFKEGKRLAMLQGQTLKAK